jgi:hypothetical protein
LGRFAPRRLPTAAPCFLARDNRVNLNFVVELIKIRIFELKLLAIASDTIIIGA